MDEGIGWALSRCRSTGDLHVRMTCCEGVRRDAAGSAFMPCPSNQRRHTFTKSRNVNCRIIMLFFGCSVRRLGEHWSKTGVYIFAVARLTALAPSPVLDVDSHRRSYCAGTHRDT